jgi:D-alanyl-D-alanine carboxypeptidase/D-alanyl-D-alanine-endopeptidase (penicillin-binding protein 4)
MSRYKRVFENGASGLNSAWKIESRVFRLFLIVLISGSVLLRASLPSEIEQMIEQEKIDPQNLSIYITETGSGKAVASHREGTFRTPASVIKLLTTYAALLEFGPEFRWPTRFYFTGTFRRGVIKGDLIIKAYGDPTISYRNISSIVKRLERVGVRKITGDLVVDRSFFDTGDRINSGFDKNRYSEYNAMPDALMFNDHLCRIIIDPRHGTPVVRKSIPDQSYQIINRLTASDSSCRGSYSWPRINIDRSGNTATVIFSGTLSRKCPLRRIDRVLSHPYSSFYYALKHELKKSGISFAGKLRLSSTPPSARVLMTYRSAPLLDIISKTNKKDGSTKN